MTERRPPLHLAVLVGASTAVYAVSLAGVTAVQSSADRALILRQSPAAEAAARLKAGHDGLEAEIERATRAYVIFAARYDELSASLSSLETSLESYARQAGQLSGAARALPERVRLPAVTRAVRSVASKPTVNATTGASGG